MPNACSLKMFKNSPRNCIVLLSVIFVSLINEKSVGLWVSVKSVASEISRSIPHAILSCARSGEELLP